MSLLDFINVLLGNYQPAFISFFNNIDEDGYPMEEDFEDDDLDGEFEEEEEMFDEEEEEMFDEEESDDDDAETDDYDFDQDGEGDYE